MFRRTMKKLAFVEQLRMNEESIAITTDFAFLYLPTGAVSEGILAQIYPAMQTVCPALLLNGPICAMYMLLFTGADSPSVLSYIMGLFMSSFTIFSPAIVLVFMKDYRNYILIALRLRKPSQITKVTASEPRSAR
ncbi:hypothetical protein COOONC_25362 [Cooperia oncophora]